MSDPVVQPEGMEEESVGPVVRIPLSSRSGELELPYSELPDADTVSGILKEERVDGDVWAEVALAFRRTGRQSEYEKILEEGHQLSTMRRTTSVKLLVAIGGHVLEKGLVTRHTGRQTESDLDSSERLFGECLNNADLLSRDALLVDVNDQSAQVLNSAVRLLKDPSKASVTKMQGQLVHMTKSSRPSIRALMLLGSIYFHQQQFRSALDAFKRVMRLRGSRDCPNGLRLAIGYCFFALRMLPQATAALQRCIDVYESRVGDETEIVTDEDRRVYYDAQAQLAIIERNSWADATLNSDLTPKERMEAAFSKSLSRAAIVFEACPTHPVASFLLAENFFNAGDDQGATALAHITLLNSHCSALQGEALCILARIQHRQKNFRAAHALYKQGVEIDAHLPVLKYGLAQCMLAVQGQGLALEAGGMEGALNESIKILLGLLPSHSKSNKDMRRISDVLRVLGTIYYVQDEYEKAVPVLRQCLSIHKEVLENNPSAQQAATFLSAALSSGGVGDATSALDLFDRLLNPTNDVFDDENASHTQVLRVLQFNRALCYQRTGNFLKAFMGYVDALGLGKLSPRPHSVKQLIAVLKDRKLMGEQLSVLYAVGRWCEERYAFDNATSVYERLLEDCPVYVEAYVRLACISKRRGQWNRAAEWLKWGSSVIDSVLQQASKTKGPSGSRIQKNFRPYSVSIAMHFGNLFEQVGNFTEAQKLYQKAGAIAGTMPHPEVHVAQGNTFFKGVRALDVKGIGDHARHSRERQMRHFGYALQCYSRALKMAPDFWPAAVGVAAVLAHKGYASESQQLLQNCRECSTGADDYVVLCNSASAYVLTAPHTLDAARALYRKAELEYPQHRLDTSLFTSLARTYSFMSYDIIDFEAASGYLLKAIRIEPLRALHWFHMALLCIDYAEYVQKGGYKTVVKSRLASKVSEEAVRAVEIDPDDKDVEADRQSLQQLAIIRQALRAGKDAARYYAAGRQTHASRNRMSDECLPKELSSVTQLMGFRERAKKVETDLAATLEKLKLRFKKERAAERKSMLALQEYREERMRKEKEEKEKAEAMREEKERAALEQKKRLEELRAEWDQKEEEARIRGRMKKESEKSKSKKKFAVDDFVVESDDEDFGTAGENAPESPAEKSDADADANGGDVAKLGSDNDGGDAGEDGEQVVGQHARRRRRIRKPAENNGDMDDMADVFDDEVAESRPRRKGVRPSLLDDDDEEDEVASANGGADAGANEDMEDIFGDMSD